MSSDAHASDTTIATAPAAMLCALGFDVGSKRIGVAVGNTLTGSARAIAVVDVRADGPDWTAVGRLIAQWRPQCLIIGEPLTLDGATQTATRAARRFAHQVHERFALPAILVDERSSSREAGHRFAKQRREGQVRRRDAAALDAVAAQVILERWLAGAA